jgi:hypothetical protein
MKCGLTVAGMALGVVVATSAVAAPNERTGFQMAIRTGVSVPFGDMYQGTKLSDFSSVQVPLLVDLGGKPIPQLFLGGYIGPSFGGAGSEMAKVCDAADASCVGVSFRLGVEAQVHLMPQSFTNPWLGYGIGFESLAIGLSGNTGSTATSGVSGVELAHFMGGLDLRLSRVFGIGPYVDLALGHYTTLNYDDGGIRGSVTIDSADRATHGWVTLGARFVFFP